MSCRRCGLALWCSSPVACSRFTRGGTVPVVASHPRPRRPAPPVKPDPQQAQPQAHPENPAGSFKKAYGAMRQTADIRGHGYQAEHHAMILVSRVYRILREFEGAHSPRCQPPSPSPANLAQSIAADTAPLKIEPPRASSSVKPLPCRSCPNCWCHVLVSFEPLSHTASLLQPSSLLPHLHPSFHTLHPFSHTPCTPPPTLWPFSRTTH